MAVYGRSHFDDCVYLHMEHFCEGRKQIDRIEHASGHRDDNRSDDAGNNGGDFVFLHQINNARRQYKAAADDKVGHLPDESGGRTLDDNL